MPDQPDAWPAAPLNIYTRSLPYVVGGGQEGARQRSVEFFRIEDFGRRLRIRATRTLDLLDLTFAIQGVGFTPATNMLEGYDPGERHFLTVIFPPQHIAETIHPRPLDAQGGDACGVAAGWPQAHLRPARETRLCFRIHDVEAFTGPLTIARLTNWAGMDLLVDPRARAGIGDDATSQLKALFPTIGDGSGVTTPVLLQRLTEALQPPADEHSALELVRDLVFSPSEASAWAIPGRPAKADPDNAGGRERLPLWTARLDGAGRTSLRAIHSHRIAQLPVEEDLAEGDNPMSALSLRNHWDIVAQTSLYGIPAMLKVKQADHDGSQDEAQSQSGSDAGADAGRDNLPAPPPNVVPSPFAALPYVQSHVDYYKRTAGHADVGLALARPFADSDISLSSLGAVMDLNWAGDPARVLLRKLDAGGQEDSGHKGYTGFNLERLSYRTFLGRDSRVEAVEKGYLLPLGVRASLLTICERRIYGDAQGKPVSHEVRRRVIFIPRNLRRYPGPYQFDDGRAFPAHRLQMLTTVTPDLLPVDNEITGLGAYSVFWPKVAGGVAGAGVDFAFEWTTQDATAKSNLLFVLNTVVSRPDLMKLVADRYNLAPETRRRAYFGGARQRYATPEKTGDTSFDTNYWVLGAQGRMGADAAEVFYMDGRLEGADQPPIYPVMTAASINVQTVEQMIGTPQGAVEVKFYEPYRLHGFAKATPAPVSRMRQQAQQAGGSRGAVPQNKAEIFLVVTAGSAALASGKQSNSTGGVASPQANVAALSRNMGMIGGEKLPKAAPTGAIYDFSDAEKGKFNPKKFFNGAKLLGIIDLGDIAEGLSENIEIDAAAVPRLNQVLDYGAGTLEDVARKASEALLLAFYGRDGRGGISQALVEAQKTINRKLAALPAPANQITFSDLVTRDLIDALELITNGTPPQLHTALKSLAKVPTVTAVEAVIRLGERINRQIASYVDDPVPELAKEAWQALADLRQMLVKGAAFQALRDTLRDLVLARVRQSLAAAIDAALQGGDRPLGPILFGPHARDVHGDPLTSKQIFAQPGLALLALQDNLLGGAFDQLTAAAWPLVVQAGDLLARAESLALGFKADIDDAILAMFAEVEQQLEPLDTTRPDLRLPVHLDRFRQDLLDAVKAQFDILVRRDSAAEERADPLAALDRRIAEFSNQSRSAILAALTLRASGKLIRARDVAKLNTLVADMVKRLHDRIVVARVTQPLHAQVARLRKLTQDGAGQLLDTMELVSKLALDLYRTSELPGLVGGVTDLTKHVRAFALALLDKGMGAYNAAAHTDEIVAAAAQVKRAADTLAGQQNWHLKQVGVRLQRLATDVTDAVNKADTGLRALETKARDTLTGTSTNLLDPLGEALRLRARLLADLRDALGVVAAIPPGQAAVDADDLRTALIALARALLPGTAVANGANGWDWAEVKAVVDALRAYAATGPVRQHAERVQVMVTQAVAQTTALTTALGRADSLAKLRQLVEEDGAALLDLVDRRLTGSLLQLTALPRQMLTDLEAQSTALLADLWHDVADHSALAQFRRLSAQLDQFDDALAKLAHDFPPIARFMPIVLGGPASLTNLTGSFAALRGAIDRLVVVADRVPENKLPQAIQQFIDRDLPTVRTAFVAFTEALAAIRIADVGQVLMQELRRQLEATEKALADLLRSFVPTQLTTTYAWQTDLGEFPRGEGAIFVPLREPCLTINGTFKFDFMTGEASSEVAGKLAPFALKLLTKDFLMATINFGTCTFTSQNGAAPVFAMTIEGVEMGPLLKFLQPLQEWLCPQGSGFYLKPCFAPPGIEAGYIFDAGLIQLGSLQFINVSFGVTAKLPFTGESARFGITLGSAERPFMVANPPYGGGGWVYLDTDGQGSNTTKLSIFFGGVSAIRFGPLNAQGRIVAGLYVESYVRPGTGGKTSSLLLAYFEAVGSGSIAFFSVSVMLRVQLVQANSGAMYGSTEYTFKFKVGWASYKYKVKANYKIANGKESLTSEREDAAVPGPKAIHTVHLVDKAQRWDEYRKLVDTALLTA